MARPLKRDLWAEASANLDPKTDRRLKKITNAQDTAPFTAETIVALISQMEEKERISRDNQTKHTIKVGGRELTLARLFHRIAEFLKNYIAVVDIISSFDPVHMALPWAAVRFVLVAIVSAQEQSESVLNIMEHAVRLVYKGQVFESVYTPETLPITDSSSKRCLDDLNGQLVKLYRAIVKAVAFCGSRLLKHKLGRDLVAIFKLCEIQEVTSELLGLESSVQESAQLADKVRNQSISTKLLSHLELCSNMTLPKILVAVTNQEMCNDLESISQIPFRAHHDFVTRTRVVGTGEWILKQREFNAWKEETVSSLLLLYGDVGTGKTYLVSRVIDHIIQDADDSHAVAYFYCNRDCVNEEPNQSRFPRSIGDHILCSLVRQLSSREGAKERIHPEVKGIKTRLAMEGSRMNTERCRMILPKILKSCMSTTIILDALDECPESSRRELLETLEELLETIPRLKVFISSRKEPDIVKHLRPRHIVDLKKGQNTIDIAHYAQKQLSLDTRWHKLDPDLREHLISVLRERSKGMFQWAALQVQEILSATKWSNRAIEQQLDSLPRDLEEAYDKSWKQLAHPKDKDLRDRLFRWVFCSFHYLPSKELGWAAQIDPMTDDDDDMEDEFDDQMIHRLGGNLLTLDEKTHRWRFCHLSAREYVERHHFNETQAHQFVSMACLEFLCTVRYTPKVLADPSPRYMDWFIRYITAFALRHVAAQDTAGSKGMVNRHSGLLRRFVGSMDTPSEAFSRWRASSRLSPSIPPPRPPIFVLCAKGVFRSLSDWWADRSIDLNMCDERGMSLLSIAIKNGHEPIWRFLLDKEVDIERGSPLPLEVAASGDCWEVFNELLNKGAKVDAASARNAPTALMLAAGRGGGGRYVERLVALGADVNYHNCSSSPLIKAVEWISHERLRRMMPELDSAGDVVPTVKETPRKDSVERLLDAGADVNLVVPSRPATALAAAALWMESGLFRLLLDRGANIHLSNGCKSILMETVNHLGTPSTVHEVLDVGANVNQVLSLGERATALSCAVGYYHPLPLPMVEVLLKAGADPNLGNRRNNPLCSAAEVGNGEYVKLLLGLGANPSALLEEGLGSPLAVAAYHRRVKVCNILLDTGRVDVNTRLRGGSPNVLFAAMAGHQFDGGPNIPQLLLERGAALPIPLNASLGGSLFQLPGGRTSFWDIQAARGFTPTGQSHEFQGLPLAWISVMWYLETTPAPRLPLRQQLRRCGFPQSLPPSVDLVLGLRSAVTGHASMFIVFGIRGDCSGISLMRPKKHIRVLRSIPVTLCEREPMPEEEEEIEGGNERPSLCLAMEVRGGRLGLCWWLLVIVVAIFIASGLTGHLRALKASESPN